jgi:small subunit ribosomal protein S8
MTDPIADLLARIRNAQTAKHETLSVPHSKLKQGVVKILYEEGFIGPYKVDEGDSGRKDIQITLRYTAEKKPLIAEMIRASRPGRRYYRGYREIRPVRSGMGVAVLSTPKGILTDRQAREEKVGGEILFTIW